MRPLRGGQWFNRAETSGADDGSMGTRRIQIGCEFVYRPRSTRQWCSTCSRSNLVAPTVKLEWWRSEPSIAVRGYTDLYGNPGFRAVLPAGRSSFGYSAVAWVPDATEDADEDAPECPPDALPDDTLIYILPSRYCLPDVLGDEAWSRFGGLSPGTAGCRPSATTSTTT